MRTELLAQVLAALLLPGAAVVLDRPRPVPAPRSPLATRAEVERALRRVDARVRALEERLR